MPLYEFDRSIEEIELLFPRAKKEVCARRRVVRVTAVGLRSRRAVGGVELALERFDMDGCAWEAY
jgi:hypothetical protein